MSHQGRTMADSGAQKEREIKQWDQQRKIQNEHFTQENQPKTGGCPVMSGTCDSNKIKNRETEENKGIGEKLGDAYEKTKETIGSMFGQSKPANPAD